MFVALGGWKNKTKHLYPSSSFFSTSSSSSTFSRSFHHWDFSSESDGVCSRGSDMLLWRSHSLCSSVASFSLLLVPLSRKLARGGRTFTPFTVTEPSMALRSWMEKDHRVDKGYELLIELLKDNQRECLSVMFFLGHNKSKSRQLCKSLRDSVSGVNGCSTTD